MKARLLTLAITMALLTVFLLSAASAANGRSGVQGCASRSQSDYRYRPGPVATSGRDGGRLLCFLAGVLIGTVIERNSQHGSPPAPAPYPTYPASYNYPVVAGCRTSSTSASASQPQVIVIQAPAPQPVVVQAPSAPQPVITPTAPPAKPTSTATGTVTLKFQTRQPLVIDLAPGQALAIGNQIWFGMVKKIGDQLYLDPITGKFRVTAIAGQTAALTPISNADIEPADDAGFTIVVP